MRSRAKPWESELTDAEQALLASGKSIVDCDITCDSDCEAVCHAGHYIAIRKPHPDLACQITRSPCGNQSCELVDCWFRMNGVCEPAA